jgi:NAD dependent epimerase/dehydratase family enzyme
MGTDAELVLKSRRIVPGRLLEAGFAFTFPDWPAAAADLVARRSQGQL